MNDNHYGFALPEELILLRDQIRRFMREEVRPIEDQLPHDATGCSAADRARLRGQAEAMGLTRLTVPEEYGGNPVGALARVIIAEGVGEVPTRRVRAGARRLRRWTPEHHLGRHAGANRKLRCALRRG